jgi:RNase P/RNase MRP subunit p30
MFIFLEYNDLISQNIKELKKLEIEYIVLFKINLNNKDQIRKDLDNIKELIKSQNYNYNAIQINLEKIDNSTQGIINNFKKEFDILIGLGGLNKINRFFIENTNIDFLQDPHNSNILPKIDFIHHLNSGINHILCKMAKANNIKFFFSLNFLDKSAKLHISKDIGRINQNIIFARKYNVNTYINYTIQKPNQIKKIFNIKKILNIFDLSTEQKTNNEEVLNFQP